eukprot:g29745.t1
MLSTFGGKGIEKILDAWSFRQAAPEWRKDRWTFPSNVSLLLEILPEEFKLKKPRNCTPSRRCSSLETPMLSGLESVNETRHCDGSCRAWTLLHGLSVWGASSIEAREFLHALSEMLEIPASPLAHAISDEDCAANMSWMVEALATDRYFNSGEDSLILLEVLRERPWLMQKRRNLEGAMKQCSEVDFEVRWLPFQLDPAASEKASSRMEAYAKKFGKGKEEVKQMGAWMKSKFDAAELPYNFTEYQTAKVSNTFDAHRVLTAAYKHGGAAAQDKAAEALFHSYFAKETPGIALETLPSDVAPGHCKEHSRGAASALNGAT